MSANDSRSPALTSSVLICYVVLLLALSVVLSASPKIRAADYWLAPKGRDTTGPGSRTRPWATLQYAADRVRPGDTVHVLDGDYAGFDLRHGGNQNAAVTFKAEGKRVRIVRRNHKTPDGINVEGANHVRIEGFVVNDMPRAGVRLALGSNLTIRGIRAARNGAWGIFTAFCDDLAIIGNQVSDTVQEHGIYVSNSGDRPIVRGNVMGRNRGCGLHMNGDVNQGGDGIISDALVENNIVLDNGMGGGSGINCDGVQHSTIQNNLLYDNHASGISLCRVCSADGSSSNTVINNTIIQATDGRWALNIKDRSTNNLIANNILLHKGSRGSINLSEDSLSGFRSDYNIVTDRFSPDDGARFISLTEWRIATGLDRHSRVSKPESLFVDLVSSDYHLRDGSPAIDAADPAKSPRTDLEARARPVGNHPDIGAYERGP